MDKLDSKFVVFDILLGEYYFFNPSATQPSGLLTHEKIRNANWKWKKMAFLFNFGFLRFKSKSKNVTSVWSLVKYELLNS